jgi:hypothetical protein
LKSDSRSGSDNTGQSGPSEEAFSAPPKPKKVMRGNLFARGFGDLGDSSSGPSQSPTSSQDKSVTEEAV